MREYGSLDAVPAQSVQNVRNDMYLAGEALRHIAKTGQGEFNTTELASLGEFEDFLDEATKYIPIGSRSPSPSRLVSAPWSAGSGLWSLWESGSASSI